MLGTHQLQEAPLDSQQKRTFASLILSHFLLFMSLWRAYLTFIRDFMLSLPPQLRDWLQPKVSRKLRRGRRRVHCELGLVGFLWGRHFVPPLHEFPQTFVWFWSHLFYLFVWRVLHISDRRSRGLNTWIFISFFLGLRYKNHFYSLCLFFFELEFINFFLEWREKTCNSFFGYCYSKGYLLNWWSGQRNTMWDWVINWWKVVWR